jgi:hypothetical protein
MNILKTYSLEYRKFLRQLKLGIHLVNDNSEIIIDKIIGDLIRYYSPSDSEVIYGDIKSRFPNYNSPYRLYKAGYKIK